MYQIIDSRISSCQRVSMKPLKTKSSEMNYTDLNQVLPNSVRLGLSANSILLQTDLSTPMETSTNVNAWSFDDDFAYVYVLEFERSREEFGAFGKSEEGLHQLSLLLSFQGRVNGKELRPNELGRGPDERGRQLTHCNALTSNWARSSRYWRRLR